MRALARFFKGVSQTLGERTKLLLLLTLLVVLGIGWADEHLRVVATANNDFQAFEYVANGDGYAGAAVKMSRFAAYYYDIILTIGFAIILASSLNLVNGHTGQFSLGHAGFMAVGAYVASIVTFGKILPTIAYPAFNDLAWTQEAWASSAYAGTLKTAGWLLTLPVNAGIGLLNAATGAVAVLPPVLQFPAALLLGGLSAAFSGLLVGVPSLRLRGDYLAIVTLGFNEIIRVVFLNYEPVNGATGLNGIASYTNFTWTFVWVAITIYVIYNLVNSTYGRGFLAVRDDEIAAEAMGINTTRYKVLAFVIAAFFAGIAGGLYAHFKRTITPETFSFLKSVDIVVIVIIGGLGSTWGVTVAAILLTIVPEWLRKLSESDWLKSSARYLSSNLPPEEQNHVIERTQAFFANRMIFFALLLIIVMIMRPQGLFGAGVIKKEKKAVKPLPKPQEIIPPEAAK